MSKFVNINFKFAFKNQNRTVF